MVNLSRKNIQYIYDATGIKLKKIVSTGTTTEYAGNFIYENGYLKMFSHPEGYVESPVFGAKRAPYKYAYQYKDHLGNIRLTYMDINQNNSGAVSLEILEENNYYPFGLKHKGYNSNVSANVNSMASKFGFNGMELEDSDVNGDQLNLYEMDIRQYDPAIARWTSLDPVVHHEFSTYSAFDNSPIYWADPSGGNSESYFSDTLSDTDPDPPVKTIELDEVVVTGKSGSKRESKGPTWSNETSMFAYYSSQKQYEKDYPEFANINRSQWNTHLNNTYSDAFWKLEEKLDEEERARQAMRHLMVWYTFFYMGEDLVYVLPGSMFGNLSRLSARAFSFKGGLAPKEIVYGYFGTLDDVVAYVGISKNPSVRFKAHARATDGKQFLDYDTHIRFNSRLKGRIWEQQNINDLGLKNLLNRRNEIRKSLWQTYKIKVPPAQ
ncbi:RHS repeat domain-containing protein [Winogradskyella sp.]|uniref:RHS repeat domain-containing protein n=1 Tax=Winogradskyella sp. TaxID=1883156 RepID=UPI002612F879|nr:RHS repeat-associated core domain-containing protein [Winogradskyella sp.]